MSALHRLKAYFGMVPAEDFDPAELGPGEFSPEGFGATEFDDYHSDYRSGSSGPRHVSPNHVSPNHVSPSHVSPGHVSPSHGGPHDHAGMRTGTRRSHRAVPESYDDGFATPAGHSAAPGAHPARPPSWTSGSWATKAPVRGSLAIDTASTLRPPESSHLASHQPVAPQHFTSMSSAGSVAEEPLIEDGAHPLGRIVTLHPHNYNEARPIGERYREGNPVIMNLTEMQDRDAKRLVDFAAGLAFALRGSIDKITNKVFLLSPPNVDVSPEDRRRIAEGRFFD